MNIEDTIRVLSHEMACVRRQTGSGCDRNCAACDLVLPDEQVLSAYWTALSILRAQQEIEKNEPLMFEELLDMDGEPVFVTTSRLYAGGITKYFHQWMLVDVRDEDAFLVTVYGDRFRSYDSHVVEIRRRPPEGGTA